VIVKKYFGIEAKMSQQLITATKDMTSEKSGDNSFQSTKVFLFDDYAVLKMQNINFRNVVTEDHDLKHLESLAETLLELKSKNVNVVPILAFESDEGNGYMVQSRAKGTELYDRHKMSIKDYVLNQVELLSKAPQAHFDKFVADTIAIIDAGVLIDFVGKDNFFYHESIGFQFIDLNAHEDFEYGLTDMKMQGKQIAVYGCFLPCYFDTMPQYLDTISKLLAELNDAERTSLNENNKNIFEKCKVAMLKNGITAQEIEEMISNDWFMPQKQQLDLL